MSGLSGYPDPWGPGGSFIESGFERVCDIHLEDSADESKEDENND